MLFEYSRNILLGDWGKGLDKGSIKSIHASLSDLKKYQPSLTGVIYALTKSPNPPPPQKSDGLNTALAKKAMCPQNVQDLSIIFRIFTFIFDILYWHVVNCQSDSSLQYFKQTVTIKILHSYNVD